MAACRACGEQIRFELTASGKHQPISLKTPDVLIRHGEGEPCRGMDDKGLRDSQDDAGSTGRAPNVRCDARLTSFDSLTRSADTDTRLSGALPSSGVSTRLKDEPECPPRRTGLLNLECEQIAKPHSTQSCRSNRASVAVLPGMAVGRKTCRTECKRLPASLVPNAFRIPASRSEQVCWVPSERIQSHTLDTKSSSFSEHQRAYIVPDLGTSHIAECPRCTRRPA